MKKFVLLWSVILAVALVGSAFAIDSSELRSPELAKSATFPGDKAVLVEEKAVPEEPGAITATNEYQEKDRPEKVLRHHPSLLTVPPNDDCENAELIPGPFPMSGPGTTVDATVDCPGVLDWNGVWYVFDLPYASNNVFIELCPDDVDLYTVGIVLMDDCACDDYIIRDVGSFGDCASGYLGYTMTFNNVPGPATWYWPAYGIQSSGEGLDFVWTIDITEPPPPPDNDSCETAEIIGDVVDYPFSTTTATASGYGTCMYSPDIWYLYTASISGDIVVSLLGSLYDTKLAVYDGNSCDPLSPEIECNDDFGGLQSQITYTAVQGNEYLIQVGGYSTYTGDGVISIGPAPAPPENDSCETAEAIGLVENYPFSTTQATASGYGTCMYSPDIWYVYTAEYTGPTVVSLLGSEYDTKLAVYDGNSCDPLSPEIECNDDFGGLQSQITYYAVEGNEYLIQVGGYSSNVGDGVISIMPPPPPECCQVVIPPEGSWNFITTDTDLGYTVFDNYICDYEIGHITFQGLDLYWSGYGWEECDEDPMEFNIKFYPDIGAYPDTVNPVCEYTVTPTRTATGILYGGYYELIEYVIGLPEPCSQMEGWLSIQGVGNGETCVFLWGAATSGDGLSYQRYPDGSMVQLTNDLSRCMLEMGEVSMTCDLLTPIFCRGKQFYFMLTINNPTGGEITGTLTFNGYAGYDCDPANVLNDIQRDKTYPDGETQEYYFYHVGASIVPGQYSASIGGTLSGYDLFCCFNGDIIECGPFKNGNNTTWELVQVERPEVGLPTVTSLAQNYPNPFNAATNISFDLAVAGNVSLNVYDITGRLVVTLVDGQMDASNVSSGVYFYKLNAGDYTATKKMNLLK